MCGGRYSFELHPATEGIDETDPSQHPASKQNPNTSQFSVRERKGMRDKWKVYKDVETGISAITAPPDLQWTGEVYLWEIGGKRGMWNNAWYARYAPWA